MSNFLHKIITKMRRLFINKKTEKNIEDIIADLNLIKQILMYNVKEKITGNKIVIGISGGLVDQINWYFLGKTIEKSLDRKVTYDLSWYGENIDAVRNSNRNFELLNLFPKLDMEVESQNETYLYKEFFNYKPNKEKTLLNVPTTPFYLNTFISFVDTFLTEIKQEFNWHSAIKPLLNNNNLKYYNSISSKSENSIGIHIRRTDYINFSIVNSLQVPEKDYYLQAISLLVDKLKLDKIKLYFFSDDMNWVTKNIIPLIEKNKAMDYTLIDENSEALGYLDFYLLLCTKYKVASSGRFCRAAHYFNDYQDKVLVTPSSENGLPVFNNENNPFLLYKTL